MKADTFLFVGLGNPGTQYDGTRHNIGFDIVDAFAKENNETLSLQKWDGLTAKLLVDGQTIHLVKPMTYMNLSGKSVARYVDFYKIDPENLLVIHDDLDMHLGRMKLVKGGTGGHNGIRSLVASLGFNNFHRLKIGIGRPGGESGDGRIPVERYVLTRFSSDERAILQERSQVMVEGLEMFLRQGPLKSMNFLNSFK